MDSLTDSTGDHHLEVAISAIEHYSYCPRQCALIHVEQTYDENLYTIRGRLAHERVDSGEETSRAKIRVLRGIPIWSDRLGLYGRADAVEFGPAGPYPVEYKVGRPRGRHAELQLCAQAMCLEEMLGVSIPHGAVFYRATRQRLEVDLDDDLRGRTVATIDAIRELLRTQQIPRAPNDQRCRNCSLASACLPAVVAETARLRGLQGALFRPLEVTTDGD